MQTSRKTHSNLQVLPVGSSLGGRKQRYVWDGQAIRVIDTEELATKQTKRQHLLAQLRDMSDSVKAAFMPEKDLVTPDYWAYSFWRNSHRFFSSAITVFATQVSDTNILSYLCLNIQAACKWQSGAPHACLPAVLRTPDKQAKSLHCMPCITSEMLNFCIFQVITASVITDSDHSQISPDIYAHQPTYHSQQDSPSHHNHR